MRTVNSNKPAMLADHAEVFRKGNNATPAVAAHRTFAAVGVKINHPEIEIRHVFQQNEPVRPDAETPVAQACDQRYIRCIRENAGAVVHHHKIVAGALVFMK